ncbi:hypothetical protein BD410DRAFT_799315 [Rickenella mellea]|uniref:Uncharacterized protein n=1 Tax=Rickenella mellea TaxID=50990 RepID=A0A4Y7QM77_9AGAM|nr:hypothetical protein BD410DRAFT_799315 [Rickenella mellea]
MPFDILTIICRELMVYDVLRLQQVRLQNCHLGCRAQILTKVCGSLKYTISSDKQLWVHILRYDTSMSGIPLLPYRCSLESATANVVERWVRMALQVDWPYKHAKELTVHRINLKSYQIASHVTWLKLIRGRWLLIASSSIESSSLTLWDSSPNLGDPILRAKYSLPGPVINGSVDDTSSSISVAISVGSSEIEDVLMFKYSISPFHRVVLSFPLTLFREPPICDTFRGAFSALRSSTPPPEQPKKQIEQGMHDWVPPVNHKTCWAMTIWKNYVLTVLDQYIEVYCKPDLKSQRETWSHQAPTRIIMWCCSLQPVREAYFTMQISNEGISCYSDGDAEFQRVLATRHCHGHIKVVTLQFEEELSSPITLRQIEIATNPAICMSVGSTSNKLSWLSCKGQRPRLYITNIPKPKSIHDAVRTEEIQHANPVPDGNFPLLHFFPSIDFDDARGVLLIGTTRGDICVARYRGIVKSAQGRLPIDVAGGTVPERSMRNILSQAVPMDLPLYYSKRDEILAGLLSPTFTNDTIRQWEAAAHDHGLDTPGWSSGWSSFTNMKAWVTPSLRWGIADPDFACGTRISEIRRDYMIFGDIIPIRFKEDDHELVDFRVGKRLYLHTVPAIGVVEDLPEWGLGGCPFPIPRPSNSSDVLKNQLEHMRVPMAEPLPDYSIDLQLGSVKDYDLIVGHIAMRKDLPDVDPNPEIWSEDEWKILCDLRHADRCALEDDDWDDVDDESSDEEEEDEEEETLLAFFPSCDYMYTLD